jgi:RNA polymerase sigma factor (sigma-70 family)
MRTATTHEAIAAIWRIEAPKVIAAVARMVRDVGLAEDLAQDALIEALEHWPREGLPDRPGAWLTTTARRKALDRLRREQLNDERLAQFGAELEAREAHVVPDFVDGLDARRADAIGDELLSLIFTACHPVLSPDARVALTLKLLGGLTTAEIARACLQSEATVAQRIVRAKRTLGEAGVPFEVPRGPALAERLATVLSVVYLIFNEGYTATRGEDWMRLELCEEALRLGRMLASLAPHEPEVQGLLALMALQASRSPARTDGEGRPVLLADQDRQRWDRLLIRQGLEALDRALACCRAQQRPLGNHVLQAAIAACHARAARAEQTDWPAIVALYDALLACTPSPVVALNRAVAVAMAQGPQAGLDLVDALQDEPALRHYHWLPAVRADLLMRLGRHAPAQQAFEAAAALAGNAREAALLRQRAADAALAAAARSAAGIPPESGAASGRKP